MSLSGLDAGVAVLSPVRSASRLEEEVRACDTIRDDPFDAPEVVSGFSTVQFGSVYFGVLISGAQPISAIRARRLR